MSENEWCDCDQKMNYFSISIKFLSAANFRLRVIDLGTTTFCTNGEGGG